MSPKICPARVQNIKREDEIRTSRIEVFCLMIKKGLEYLEKQTYTVYLQNRIIKKNLH